MLLPVHALRHAAPCLAPALLPAQPAHIIRYPRLYQTAPRILYRIPILVQSDRLLYQPMSLLREALPHYIIQEHVPAQILPAVPGGHSPAQTGHAVLAAAVHPKMLAGIAAAV